MGSINPLRIPTSFTLRPPSILSDFGPIHMFLRPQNKKQGFAKEQKVADAQLQSLRQLGLIGPETKGFASAWGGTEPIASTASRPPSRPGPKKSATKSKNYTTIPSVGDLNEPTFPEKGESIISFNLISTFARVDPCKRYCDDVKSVALRRPESLGSQSSAPLHVASCLCPLLW